MRKLNRQEVIRKAIVVFEAIKRMTSKGGAGLEPERGAAAEFDMVDDCTQQLREILREMQANEHEQALQQAAEEQYERSLQAAGGREGTEMKDWQTEAAGGPPERLVFRND